MNSLIFPGKYRNHVIYCYIFSFTKGLTILRIPCLPIYTLTIDDSGAAHAMACSGHCSGTVTALMTRQKEVFLLHEGKGSTDRQTHMSHINLSTTH